MLGDGPEPSEKILESISEAQVGDFDSKASRDDSKTRASKDGDNDDIRVLPQRLSWRGNEHAFACSKTLSMARPGDV